MNLRYSTVCIVQKYTYKRRIRRNVLLYINKSTIDIFTFVMILVYQPLSVFVDEDLLISSNLIIVFYQLTLSVI